MYQDRAQSSKIADIQVLRGIAILLVLGNHSSLAATLLGEFPIQITMPFFIGVELFFVISGYVVTMSLQKDGFNGLRFLIKRMFRLIPAILIFLAMTHLIMSFIRESPSMPDFARQLFAIPQQAFNDQALSILAGYFVTLDSPKSFMNGAMWSLSVEDQFYAGIAIVSLFTMISRRLTRIPAKWWVMAISAGLFILVFRMRMRILLAHHSHLNERGLVHYLVHWKFDFLSAGVILALFDSSFPGRAAKYLRDSGPAFTGYLLVLPCVVLALCETPFLPHGRFLTGIGLPFALFCFGMLVLSAGNQCAFPQTHGRIYRFLEYLGNRSYTYYLFHLPAMLVAWIIIYRWIPWGLKSPIRYASAQIAVSAVLLAPFVEVVYRLVELPLTRFGKNLVDGRRPKAAGAVAPMGNQILPMPLLSGSSAASAA